MLWEEKRCKIDSTREERNEAEDKMEEEEDQKKTLMLLLGLTVIGLLGKYLVEIFII